MNERIKELMEYAVRFRLDPDSNTHEALVQPEDLELFAELIVRECAKIGDRHGGIKVRSAITKHFGVEE